MKVELTEIERQALIDMIEPSNKNPLTSFRNDLLALSGDIIDAGSLAEDRMSEMLRDCNGEYYDKERYGD